MYLPAQFSAREPSAGRDLMRAYPFASLISVDDEGASFVSHLPLHLELRPGDDGAEENWVLLGHCAKPNPHWRYLQARPQALVTFLGPHAYMSPSVYPDLKRVPTWNYLAVHCTVQATLLDDPVDKDALLKKQIDDHEPAYADQWRSLGEDFASKMLVGIVAFELAVTRLECKLKLNQHRPEAHGAMRQGYATGGEDEQALGEWMDRLGIGGPAKPEGESA